MKKIVLSILLFFTIEASAFMNVETLRQSDESGFFGSFNLKATGSSGSTDKFVNSFSTQNVYRSDKHEVLVFLNHRYGEVSNNKNTDKGNFHIRYSRSLVKKAALEFYGQVEFDKFRALKLRRIYGSGLRLNFLNKEATSIYFGAGAFFEKEDLEGDPDEQTARGNIYTACVQTFENKMKFSSTVYYQPSFSKSDFRLRANTSLGIPLTDNFQFTIEFKAAHDSAPPTGVVKTDILYLTGINFSY